MTFDARLLSGVGVTVAVVEQESFARAADALGLTPSGVSRAVARLQAFSGRSIDVPCCFIAGKSDWGTYQSPGALDAMASSACTRFRGIHLIEGAGHWVQQEQPAAVSKLLIEFLQRES